MFIEDIKVKAEWLYGRATAKNYLRAVLSDATLSMLLYRVMSFCDRLFFTKILAMFLSKINAILCGAVIGKSAQFGRGFVILHSVGVVINTKVRGGENIYIESGVVIGESKRGCPVLENNIFIGSGAKIIGDITVGNHVTVGANAVVVKSIPDNAVVGGVPAKIIRMKDLSETDLID